MPERLTPAEQAAIEAALESDSADRRKGAVSELAYLLSEEDQPSAAWARKILSEVLFGKSGRLQCSVVETKETRGCPTSRLWIAVECALPERGVEAVGTLRKALTTFPEENREPIDDILNMVPAAQSALKGLAQVTCPNICPELEDIRQEPGGGCNVNKHTHTVTCWMSVAGTCTGTYVVGNDAGRRAYRALWEEGFGTEDVSISILKHMPPSCPGVGWIKVCVKSRVKPAKPGDIFSSPVLSKDALEAVLKNSVVLADEVKCPDKCETRFVMVKAPADILEICESYAVVCTVPGGEEPPLPEIPDDLYGFGPTTRRRGPTALIGSPPAVVRGVPTPTGQDGWLPTWEVSRLLRAGRVEREPDDGGALMAQG